MIVAPRATPLSCTEKLKLKSTAAAKAAYTAAPPSSGVATACTLRAAGVSSTPHARANARTSGTPTRDSAKASATR